MHNHLPQPCAGTVHDVYGEPCPRASKDSYPLFAKCDVCNAIIRCANGSADWYHKEEI